MSVYGSMLDLFPELIRNIDVYKTEPKINAGFVKKGKNKTIRGIIQYLKGGNTENKNGVVYEQEKPYLWTKEYLENLLFVVESNKIFRITGNNDWIIEGDFYRYDLQEITGVNDTMKTDTSIAKNMTRYK